MHTARVGHTLRRKKAADSAQAEKDIKVDVRNCRSMNKDLKN
jgi:hypothetical protein